MGRNTFACIEDVISAFRVIDSNNDGALSKKELADGMNSFGKEFVASEIESVFSLADVNSDGEICYDEFVAMMFPAAASALAKFRKHHRSLKNAKHAFDSYDIDGDGEITYEELVGGMGGEYSANEISAIFAMGDTDQDGKISFLEFSKIMIPSCQDTLTKFWKCFRNVQSVRETFKKFDADGDAAIDFAEFAEIMIPSAPERIAKLKKCFRNRTEIEAAFRRFDTNKDGAISFQEMKNGLSNCAISFTVADKDGDGEVSLSEFVDLLST